MQELRATVWRRVADATIAKVADLGSVFVALAATPDDDTLLARGVELTHAISGSAGVYGFCDEARAASALEGLLRNWPGASGVGAAQPLLAVLEQGFEEDE